MRFSISLSISLLVLFVAPLASLANVDRPALDSCDPPPEQPKQPPKK